MYRRRRTYTAARAWADRPHRALRPNLHDFETRPGLVDLDAMGYCADVAWYEVGPADADVTVVFVHGYGLNAESFYDQVDYLRAEYPRVRSLLIDLRGHGKSRPVRPASCTINGAGDDVLRVIAERAAVGPLVLVGHSMGGMVVQNVVRRCSPSVLDRLAGVLLVATSMQPFAETGLARLLRSRPAARLYRMAQRLPTKVNRVRQEISEAVITVVTAAFTGYPQMERMQFHIDMMLDTPLDSFLGFFDDLIEHSELAARTRLAGLRGTVMVGSMDIVTPLRQSERILDAWPAAKLVEVPHTGHMIILEEPRAVFEELRALLP